MIQKSTAVLLALSFLGLGSLVYLLYHKNEDEEKEAEECLKLKTSRCTVIEVKIPKESIGIVIGRQGSSIKEIQAKSDTKINFKDEKVTDEYKVCVIRGTAEAAQYAESLIHEKIVSQPLIETYEMSVPIQAIGRIIGKNGENIRAISRNSNAKIIVENTTVSPVSNERKIIIKGTSEQIALAKVLVEQKVEEDAECRNRIESKVANRSPRNKSKFLMLGMADPDSTANVSRKETLTATGSDGLLEVYVSAIESPDRLWLQMKGPCTVELDRLQEEMTDYYTKDENRELHFLKEVSMNKILFCIRKRVGFYA